MLRPMMTQYHVSFAADGGATMGRLTRLLNREKIDPATVLTASGGGKAAVQFLAYKNPALREKLERVGGEVREDQVFQLEMPNDPAELHRLLRALAEKGVRVISLYSAAEGDRMRVVLAADPTANAVAVAARLGYQPDYFVFELGAPRRR